MKSILFIRQSSIQPGLRHIEGYIEAALGADPLIRTDVFDLVTRVRDVAAPGLSREEIICRYRDYFSRTLKESGADAVLFMNGFAVESFFPGVMRDLHALGVPMIAWHADDPYYADLQTPIASCMRVILTVDRSTVDHWKTCGADAHFLPLAFAPQSIEGLRPCRDEHAFRADVCFVGTPFKGSRRVRIIDDCAEYLSALATQIGGASAVDRWSQHLTNAHHFSGGILDRVIDPREMLSLSLDARINLNIHKESFGHVWDRNARGIIARSPNERFFALGGTGAFQLVDDSRPDLAEFFPPRYPATFDLASADSLKDALGRYLADSDVRNTCADTLARIIRAEHTYAHRIAFIRGLL